MQKKIAFLILVVSLMPFPDSAIGQNTQSKKRPTIGLVLSGGGARGFAHIGVLKVLEANRVPVDFVGGASMGGLVGALYAMGMTPAEIESAVVDLNWGNLFQSTTSFDNLSFRRKEDRRNIPSPVPLKGKIDDLKLPNALNSGHEIGLLIDRLTLGYATVSDFDQLPIPFRAVGTDMVKGESVTLKGGSLSRSLRATMSVPGVFAPVEVDGRILSDGGLVNNIPTDVVKAMGADIVLVVNIETQLGGREALESLPGILAQTINIATVDNSRRSLRQADLILSPDLGKYGSSDFANAREIIELGYNGALEKTALLKPLSLDDSEWQSHLAARRARRRADAPPVPSLVAVEGLDPDQTQLIKEKLGDKYAGAPLDTAKQGELAKDLSELTGTGRFDALDYQLKTRDGRTELVIGSSKVGGETAKPTRLELGLDVNSVESDNVNFNFLARLTFFDIGKHGAEWRNDLRLGSNGFLASEYYRPLGRTKFFIAPHGSYERRRINVFSDGSRIAEYVGQTAQIGADIGYAFNSKNELRAGYTVGYQSISRRIGDPLLPDVQGIFRTASVNWAYDSLDKAQVPTNGVLARSSFNYLFDSPGTSGSFAQGETRLMAFRPLSERNIVFAIGGGGTTFGETAPLLRQFTLGGPFRIGGYGFEQLRGSNYIHAGGGVLHNPAIIPSFLGGKTYVGAWYEAGSMFERLGNANYRQSVSGGAIFETPVGPVFIGGSVNENGRGRFYFSFGRVFK
jgi:NTE family protein